MQPGSSSSAKVKLRVVSLLAGPTVAAAIDGQQRDILGPLEELVELPGSTSVVSAGVGPPPSRLPARRRGPTSSWRPGMLMRMTATGLHTPELPFWALEAHRAPLTGGPPTHFAPTKRPSPWHCKPDRPPTHSVPPARTLAFAPHSSLSAPSIPTSLPTPILPSLTLVATPTPSLPLAPIPPTPRPPTSACPLPTHPPLPAPHPQVFTVPKSRLADLQAALEAHRPELVYLYGGFAGDKTEIDRASLTGLSILHAPDGGWVGEWVGGCRAVGGKAVGAGQAVQGYPACCGHSQVCVGG